MLLPEALFYDIEHDTTISNLHETFDGVLADKGAYLVDFFEN